MKRVSLAAVLVGLTAIGIAQTQVAQEWPAYGRDPGGARFSPLVQITRANVASLKVVWRYHTGEPVFDVSRQPSLQVTPIVIDGTMYISTPLGKVMAIEQRQDARGGAAGHEDRPAVRAPSRNGRADVSGRGTPGPAKHDSW